MDSVYPDLDFPENSDRPFFYTNFVSTVDGKTQVLTDPRSYWPIGSELDYQTLIELRTYADLLIHGKNTALIHKTSNSLKKEEFKNARVKRGKKESLPYMVITGNPNQELIDQLEDSECKTIIVTTTKAEVAENLPKNIEVIRVGEERVDLVSLSNMLYKMGIKNILVEGGPQLLGQFLTLNLMDEVFLTIAPKIFGNRQGRTLTMVEGSLFSPEEIVNLELISFKNINNELYLRYAIKVTSNK